MFCPLQGVTPVTGVRGKGEYGHAVSILSRPPAILWFLSHRWERNSPPAGGETPLRTTNAVRNLPPHPAPSGPPDPIPSGLRPSPLDKGSQPPDPRYGGYPLQWAEHFRRAKTGVLGCGPVRPHWGPEREENWDWGGFIPAPAASEPTLPASRTRRFAHGQATARQGCKNLYKPGN